MVDVKNFDTGSQVHESKVFRRLSKLTVT